MHTNRQQKQSSRNPAVRTHKNSESASKAHHSTVRTKNQSRQANQEKYQNNNNHIRAVNYQHQKLHIEELSMHDGYDLEQVYTQYKEDGDKLAGGEENS